MNNPFAPATPVAKRLKVLLYGPAGSGKSRAALSFPRCAVIDSEGGVDLYRGHPSVPPFHVIATKTIADLETAIAFIEFDQGKTFDTLVVDCITVFYDMLREAIAKTGKGGEMGFREWSKLNTRMKNAYSKLTNLPVHVVVIAREATEYETVNGELRKTGTKPDGDKSMPYNFDVVIRMNEDHSGTVKKSRAHQLGENGRLQTVNWSVFEPIANAHVQGDTVTQQSEEDVIEETADAIWDDDAMTAFTEHWRAQSVTNAYLLQALGVKGLREWKKGRKAADSAVNAYIERVTGNGKTESVGK